MRSMSARGSTELTETNENVGTVVVVVYRPDRTSSHSLFRHRDVTGSVESVCRLESVRSLGSVQVVLTDRLEVY